MAEPSTNFSKVLANVVDIQQTILFQFDNITKKLENLKIDQNAAIASLRDDLRRTDDRAQKQVDELRNAHNKEVERLLNIVQTLLAKDTATAAVPQVPNFLQQQQAAQNAAIQHAMMYQNQQRQINEEMQRIQHAQAVAMMANNAAAIPKPAVPVIVPAVPKPVIPTPVVSIPKEQTPAVSIPPAVKPIIVPKTEEAPKPVVIPPAQPKSAIVPPVTAPAATSTFSFTNNGTSIFGKKPDATPTATSIFGTPVTAAPVTPKPAEKDDEDTVEEYEPTADFKPVIPLPDLVEAKTGEEDETVLFNNRSKLYIWFRETGEWKERGVGDLKVLQHNDTKKYRVVMRREQVLKVCANFPIIGDMAITAMAKNDKASSWHCTDFSEDEPEHVQLSARFATVEISKEFRELFEKAVAEHKQTSTPVKTQEVKIEKEIKQPEKKIEQPVKKDEGKEVEIPSNKENVGFGDAFKLAAGTWECKECYVRNKEVDSVCSCCGAGKDGKTVDKSASIFNKPSILTPSAGTSKFSFGQSAAAAAKEPLPNQTKSPQFGSTLNGSSSIFGGSTPKNSIFGGGPQKDSPANASTASTTPVTFSFDTKAATPVAAPKFNFMKAAENTNTSGNASALFGISAKTEPSTAGTSAVGFSFNKAATTGDQAKIPFSFLKGSGTPTGSNTEDKKAEEPKSIFGSFANGGQGESFASLAAKSANKNIFEGEAAKKAQEEFKAQKKSTSLFSKKAEDDAEENDEPNDENEEYEPNVDFKPVIPLPELIDVKTGEEGEDVLFKGRCKLYRYIRETQENKDRGVGDIKILHNGQTGAYRVVMRREQVHKLCANFRISKALKLNPKSGFPNIFTLNCVDFSDDQTEGSHEVFTIRFKEEALATSFKETFENAQKQK